MSDGHAKKPHNAGDQPGVARPSAGISPLVLVFIAVSLVIIMWQGSNVVLSSGEAHVWPASDATKVVLPPEKP
jgi:hypothetical protein